MKRHLLVVLAVIGLWAAPCAADEPAAPRPPLSEALTGDAKADYDAAKLLFEDGDFAGAASKFRQAHDRAKDPRLLWNMAVCEKGLRHYARVQGLVERYLEEGKDMLSAEQTKAARDLRDAVRAFVGSLTLSVEPGAEITIDGEPMGQAPLARAIPLDLGPHKLTAEKAGFKSVSTAFEIAGGAETKLAVVLRPVSAKARIAVLAGEGDTIAFDGKTVGSTRWQADVDAGPHSLRVTAPKRKPYELRLDLVDGSNRTVEVTLEHERAAPWPWILGGVALTGAAIVGGYFLFKPEDRPADQPVGTLPPGVVQLSGWGWAR